MLVGRNPVATSRSPARSDDPRSAALELLEERGIIVSTAAIDVGDPAAMAGMMSRFGSEWPRLGGIFHAAVAVTPSPLVNMPVNDFLAMMRTKITGARLLHTLSKSQPVEYFVNFSSYASLLGPVQFAHHAAASAVLDALACVWVAHGRRALSVNWGTWWSLQSDYRDRVARAGIRPMSAAVALDALGRLLAAGIPRAIVADFDRPILRDIYESRGSRRLLSELVQRIRRNER